jgi:hypothetical protein
MSCRKLKITYLYIVVVVKPILHTIVSVRAYKRVVFELGFRWGVNNVLEIALQQAFVEHFTL